MSRGEETATYHRDSALPIPLASLVELCQAAIRKPAGQAIPVQVQPGQLLWLARRHRVQGLAWRGLERAGADLDQHHELEADVRGMMAENMLAADAASRLTRGFERFGTAHLFVKGLTLSKLAYGDPFIKTSADIDLLVEGQELEAAAAVLKDAGFRMTLPRQTSLGAWHGIHKESQWVDQNNLLVELHSRLADSPHLLSHVRASSPARIVEIQPGLELRTLPPDDLHCYLAVHGASSMWFRLKWLADYHALSLKESRDSVLTCSSAATRLADAMSATVFGEAPPPERNRLDYLLHRISMAQITSEQEPTQRPLGTLGIHAGQVMIMEKLPLVLGEAIRKTRAVFLRN